MEWALFYVNYNGQFTSPFPEFVKIIWIFIGILYVSILVGLVIKDRRKKKI